MRWPSRNVMIGVSAAAAAIGLVAAIIAVLMPGAPTPVRPASDIPRQLFSPFTGEPVPSLGPVLAVKIDNLAPARPQTGLTSADLVYVIPVEGGLSRLLAVFSSHVPAVIGPVRSAREDDLELLRQFGRPAFAYSGAQPQLLPVVGRARVVDLYDGRVRGYFRAPDRAAPHNLYARSSQLLGQAPARARPATSGSGSAPHRLAGARCRCSRCLTQRHRSRSAGQQGTGAGWCGWTASRREPLRADSCPRPRW